MTDVFDFKSMEFWSLKVPANKSVTLNLNETKKEENIMQMVHLTTIALGENPSSKPHVIKLKKADGETVLGTLKKDLQYQFHLDAVLCSTVSFSHNGDGDIYLHGYSTRSTSPPAAAFFGDEDEDEDEEEDMDEEEDEEPSPEPIQVSANGKVDKKQQKAKKSMAPQLPESGEDDDDDDDDEEDIRAQLKGKRFPMDLLNNDDTVFEYGSEDDEDFDEDEEGDDDEDEEDDDDEDELAEGDEDDDLDAMEEGDSEDGLDDEDEEGEEEEAPSPVPLPTGKRPAQQHVTTPHPAKKSKPEDVKKGPATAPAKTGGKPDPKTPQAKGDGKPAKPETTGKTAPGKTPQQAGKEGKPQPSPATPGDEKGYETAVVKFLSGKGTVGFTQLGSGVKKPDSVPKLVAFLEARPKLFKVDRTKQTVGLA